MRLRGRGPRTFSACSAGAGDTRRLAPPGRNPFVHELRLGALQKVQVAFMTLTLFPIRLLFAAFMMLLAWPLALMASLGPADKEPEQPPALWRRLVDVLLKAIMRTMWFAGGFHHVAVKGRRALPSEAAILTLAPHSSYFDAIPVTMTMSSVVMKAESRDIPIWGTLIRYIRPVFVSRSDQDSRRKTVEEIRSRAQSGGKWPQIMIFPEGTCTNRTCLITFKPGAFIPGVPVQPVVLRYPNRLDTITWTWQGPGALEILWLTLCQFHNRVEIEFLPVYSPSEEERRNPALYASNVRRVMAEALGISVTDYTFEDCQLALAGGQLRLPADSCLLEFARLVRGLGLRPENLEKDLDTYWESAQMRMRKGGKVGLGEFAACLQVPVSPVLEDMFALFDEGGCGEVDLRECVLALSAVCRPARTLDTIQLAFKASEASRRRASWCGRAPCARAWLSPRASLLAPASLSRGPWDSHCGLALPDTVAHLSLPDTPHPGTAGTLGRSTSDPRRSGPGVPSEAHEGGRGGACAGPGWPPGSGRARCEQPQFSPWPPGGAGDPCFRRLRPSLD